MTPILPLMAALAGLAQERVVESVVPALAFGPHCSSTLTLQNLSGRTVLVDVEAHKPGGALAPLAGRAETSIRLAPREQASLQPQIEEETESAWVKVRERVPSPDLSPVLAIGAATECEIGDRLRTVGREVVYPMRNPWFDGDVVELNGGVVSLINTSEKAAEASLCYSSGTLFSNGGSELKPVCSASYDVRIPPFGAREFPVSREGSTHFSLKTQGSAIVLEMLRRLDAREKIYTVDSTIRFGSEVSGSPDKR